MAEGSHLAVQRALVGEDLVDLALCLRRVLAVNLPRRALERRIHRVAPRGEAGVGRGLGVGRGILQVAVDDALLLLERRLEILRLLVGTGVVTAAAGSVALRIADAKFALQAAVRGVAHRLLL